METRSERRIIERFSKQFEEKIKTNPVYHKIYYMLIQGVDEYVIIEELLKTIESEQQEIVRITEEKKFPKYIIKPEDF